MGAFDDLKLIGSLRLLGPKQVRRTSKAYRRRRRTTRESCREPGRRRGPRSRSPARPPVPTTYVQGIGRVWGSCRFRFRKREIQDEGAIAVHDHVAV